MEAMGAAQPAIRVAALCGSLRKASFNRGLIRSAIELTKESVKGVEIEYIDISPLPMLNTDLEVDGTYPPVVDAFRRKILQADCYLFASPEYNYSVTGPLKNAIDWASRPPNVWADKAAAIVSAAGSFGGGRAQYHLRQIGVYLDLHFINKPEFFLNAFQPPAKFDSDGNLIDEESKERLKEVILALKAFTLRLQGLVNFHFYRRTFYPWMVLCLQHGMARSHARIVMSKAWNFSDNGCTLAKNPFAWHDRLLIFDWADLLKTNKK